MSLDQLNISQEFLKNFWPNHDTTPEAIASYRAVGRSYGWLEQVQGILCSQKAKDLSDLEIDRCTKGCVCGPLLFHLGVVFREAEMLFIPEVEMEEIQEEQIFFYEDKEERTESCLSDNLDLFI